MIEFDCPACGAAVRVADEAGGRKGRCPQCQTLLLVPQAAPAPEVPAASPFPDFAPPSGSIARRVRRPAKRSNLLANAAVAVVAVAAVAGGLWWLLGRPGEAATGTLTAVRRGFVALAAVPVAPPAGVSEADAAKVLHALRSGLGLTSERLKVRITGETDRLSVEVGPGPKSETVVVPLAGRRDLRSLVAPHRDAILRVQHAERQAALAAFFRGYEGHLRGGGPLPDLSDYRESIGLNAVVGATGYATEAVVAGVPYRCGYEDAEGDLYFFLPPGTAAFTLRGRDLADGSHPVRLDLAVSVVDPPTEEPAPADPVPADEPEMTPPTDGA